MQRISPDLPVSSSRRTRLIPWLALSGGVGALASWGIAGFLPLSSQAGSETVFLTLLGLSLAVAATAVGYRAGRRHAEPPPASGDDPADAAVRAGSAPDPDADFGRIRLVEDLLGGLSDGFTLWDEQDRLLLYNENMGFRTDGGDTGSLRGIPFSKHAAAMFPRIDPQTSGGDPDMWFERRMAWHREADGSHEILMASGRWILLTERRTPSGAIMGVYTDITERKRAEDLLKQSERRLAHAQRLARVGIWEWDTATREMYWSNVLYEIVGLPADSPPLSLEQYFLLVHPSNRDIVRSTYSRLFSTGGKYNQEYQIIRPDGEVRTLRTEAEAIPDETGRPARIVGAVHDLTDLKRAERAMRKALQAADEANRTKSEFLANVSHELRTPLNAIIGFSEVMMQEVFGPLGNTRYTEYAGDIRQSGAHLLGIINDLLDYAKLEAGRLELHVETVPLEIVVGNSIRLVRDRADEEHIALVSNLSGAPETVEGDHRKIMQILLNLLSNAIKFTPRGGVVTVVAKASGDGAEILVTDTGVGMSERDIEVALAPFGQVDSSLNRQHAGTGLGLPLSRALAELHGGRLDIESAPGCGTTVRVFLPGIAARQRDRRHSKPLRLVIGGQAR
ncbi:MAG: ATP-binding protein [Rhodospirillaceae bacterium]